MRSRGRSEGFTNAYSVIASPLEGEAGPKGRVGGMPPPSLNHPTCSTITPHPSMLCIADLPLKGRGIAYEYRGVLRTRFG